MSNQRTFRVLLIEDNPADARLVELNLEDSKSKFHIFRAETLIQGLELAKTKEIDITLLDLTLPDSSGFKTLNTYLDNCPDIPVIVFTGLNNEIVGSQSVRAGAQDYLVKGQFDYKLLNRLIRYAIQRFESKQQLAETARQLHISEIRYEQAQELANFGQWEIDLVSNKMKWSSTVYRIFGFRPGSVSPSLELYLEYAHYDDKDEVEAFFNKCIKDGKSRKLEHRILVDGKKIRHVILKARIFHDDKTEETLLIGAIQDITERKKSEDVILEKALEDRIHQDKQKALEDFDFEFRTPLSSINQYLYLLEKSDVSTRQKEHLNNLGTALNDLTLTVNNLLNFSVLYNSTRAIHNEPVEMPVFFHRVEKMLPFHRMDPNCRYGFIWEGPEDIQVVTDPNQLSHILFNLLYFIMELSGCKAENIMQARLDKKGRQLDILLTSKWKPTKKFQYKHLLGWLESGKWKRLSGEEDNIQRRLQVASLLIEKMGGDLKLSIDPQRHLKASFSLETNLVEKDNGSMQIDHPMHILLVEDNFLNLSSTRHILENGSANIQVDVAENGLIAVEKHRAHRYDLILMDLQMPVMNGFEATDHIRETDKEVPIIGLSASSSKEEAQKCKLAGMNDFLLKPFTPDALMKCISKQLVKSPSDLSV